MICNRLDRVLTSIICDRLLFGLNAAAHMESERINLLDSTLSDLGVRITALRGYL